MNAHAKNHALLQAIRERFGMNGQPGFVKDGQPLNVDHARALRRAQMTLHRWSEEMCNGTIQREGPDGDGKPFRHYDRMFRDTPEKELRYPCPDREAGALRRVAEVCKSAGLYYFYQRDCRGCSLFVAAFPLDHSNYDRGVACL